MHVLSLEECLTGHGRSLLKMENVTSVVKLQGTFLEKDREKEVVVMCFSSPLLPLPSGEVILKERIVSN